MKKIKVYKQYDMMQCGIACIKIICSYYGKDFSFDYLSKYCHATTEGVSLLSIMDATLELGFQTTCNRLSISQLSEKKLPCILHWNQNHFVVLYEIKRGNKFYVADPGKGLITYSLEEFSKNWLSTISNGEERGIALFLQPTTVFQNMPKEASFGMF